MSDNFISEITLEYLMNKDQYAKYILNKSNTSSNSSSNSIRKDKKFYKKRIYDLTKQLINNEKPEGIYSGIIDTFELYTKICIEYFKTLDKTDIIQEDYNGLITDVSSNAEVHALTIGSLQNAQNTE